MCLSLIEKNKRNEAKEKKKAVATVVVKEKRKKRTKKDKHTSTIPKEEKKRNGSDVSFALFLQQRRIYVLGLLNNTDEFSSAPFANNELRSQTNNPR